MKETRLLLVLAVLGVLLAACGRPNLPAEAPSSAQGELTLRLRLQVGEVFRYRTTIEQVLKNSASQEVLRQRLSHTLRYQVEAVKEDGSAQVRATYEDISFLINLEGRQIAYPGDGGMLDVESARVLSGVIGQSALLLIAPDGTLQRIESVAPPIEALLDPPEHSEMTFTILFRPPFEVGAGQREPLIGLSLGSLPHQPVTVGASWNEQRPLLSSGPAPSFSLTHTLEGRDGGIATLSQSGTIASTVPLTTTSGPLVDVLSLSLRGTDAVDEATGLSRSASLQLEAELGIPVVQQVFTEIDHGLDPEPTLAEGQTAAPTHPPTPTLGPTVEIVPMPTMQTVSSERLSLSRTIVRERIACCDPLPPATPIPAPTALPIPTADELGRLVRDTLSGVVAVSEIVESRLVLDYLLVVYRGTREEGLSLDPPGEPLDQAIVDTVVFEWGPHGWRSPRASWEGLSHKGGDEHQLRYSYGNLSSWGRNAVFVVGETQSPSIAAVEALFDDGQVQRAAVFGFGAVFSLVAEDAHDVCELRALDAQGQVLTGIPIRSELGGACLAQQTPTHVR